ncbi:MAG: amino acid permease [Calditrichaeota bacterium]|nr:MAG: amino acid permease [Calditrichota bacterium]
MADELKQNKHADTSHVTFARDLGLFDASMIGIGAMIGAGIFVLTGIAAGVAGPASILAFVLNGFVTLLTAFAYAELASAIPRAGGGYSFVRLAFPGVTGFTAGWMLWFAYTVACSLYALGFAGYFVEFFIKYAPGITEPIFNAIGHHRSILVITLLIGTFFVWLNIHGAEVTGKTENVLTISKIIILGIFVYFGFERIMDEPSRISENLFPFFPKGTGGVLVAMGLTFIAFEGYDLIATVAEEIKNPEKNIPKATFISLAVTITIYLLILFVSLVAVDADGLTTWEFLGKFKETAIVRAAEGFMPAIGVAVIVAGGLLSTMSALNATVMAASRVAFSMGRDLWLPKAVSKIHPKKRTPHIAIVITGVILLIMALTLPIEAVGSAASLIFLLTFAMVNLSVIVLRRKHPEIDRKYRVPFYPIVPLLGFSLNIFLALYQFKFQPIAWFVTAGWVLVGVFLYYAVFEKRAAALEPKVLSPQVQDADIIKEPALLVALHNPANIARLIDIAHPIAKKRNLRLVALSVVNVPRQMPIHEGIRLSHHKEALLNQARKYAVEKNIKLETDIIIAHHISDGILSSVNQQRAKMLIMGWKGYTNTRDRLFGEVADRIVRLAPCDLALLKMTGKEQLKNCLLPTSGGPNAQLAASIINAIAADFDMKITAGYVAPLDMNIEQKEKMNEHVANTITRLDPSVKRTSTTITSSSIAAGIAKAGKEFDMVIIGAAKEPFFRKMLFGEIPEKVARYTPTNVMVVKKYEGPVKSILKRLFG